MVCGECALFNKGCELKPNQHSGLCPMMSHKRYPFVRDTDKPRCQKTTLGELWWPLMEIETIWQDTCVVCGKRATNQHHIVRRNAGAFYRGKELVPKPTVSLCGSGTTGCHGLAHENKLHFRNNHGELECIICDRPTKYQAALNLKGWKPCRVEW